MLLAFSKNMKQTKVLNLQTPQIPNLTCYKITEITDKKLMFSLNCKLKYKNSFNNFDF